jgi:DinB superfamily
MDDLRYPIGKPDLTIAATPARRQQLISEVAAAPAALRTVVRGLTDAQLATPYRPAGWTVRQVTHHVPDSHLNAYIRFKQALIADFPVIMAYDEAKWATLSDVGDVPIAVSLDLLDNVHARWLSILRAMRPDDFARGYMHPEYNRRYTLDDALAIYAWHGRHHVAHITELRAREGWR